MEKNLPPSKLGIASLVIGVCCVLDVTLTMGLVFSSSGNFSNYYPDRVSQQNLVGLIAGAGLAIGFLLAIVGIGLAVAGLVQPGVGRRPAVWGLILNGLPIVLVVGRIFLVAIR